MRKGIRQCLYIYVLPYHQKCLSLTHSIILSCLSLQMMWLQGWDVENENSCDSCCYLGLIMFTIMTGLRVNIHAGCMVFVYALQALKNISHEVNSNILFISFATAGSSHLLPSTTHKYVHAKYIASRIFSFHVCFNKYFLLQRLFTLTWNENFPFFLFVKFYVKIKSRGGLYKKLFLNSSI